MRIPLMYIDNKDKNDVQKDKFDVKRDLGLGLN